MESENKKEGYVGPYLERSGKDSRVISEQLLAPPESPLSDEQKQVVLDYEASLFDHEVESGTTICDVFRGHKGEKTTTPRFFAEAFMDQKVGDDLVQLPEFKDSKHFYDWLALNISTQTISEDDLRELAKRSATHYKETVASFLVDGQEPPAELMDNRQLVVNPDEALLYAGLTQKAREYLLGEYRMLNKQTDTLSLAKKAVVEIYLAKMNSIVAGDVNVMERLTEQSGSISDYPRVAQANNLIPKYFRNAMRFNDPKLLRKLDYIRNGMGLDDAGKASAIDTGIIAGKEAGYDKYESSERPQFSEAERKKLQDYKLDPTQMAVIFSNVLQRAGLLSSEESKTWSPKRKTRAADDLFQVVINPKTRNFAADGVSGAYLVASEPRSLYDIMLIGGFHELEHINQSQADREVGKVLRIAELKGKRVTPLRESGANFMQRQAEKRLFGTSKPIALTYAKALHELETGGDLFSASKAFYEEKCAEFPDMDLVDAAKEAADRTLRLILNGGVNSGPMSYAEELIVDQELDGASPEVKGRAGAVTSLDLVDQLRLHRFGLLPMIKDNRIDWTDAIMAELKPYIKQALATDLN